MPLYRPSELRQFLEEIHASPKKHLSQNFLTDGNILRKIVQTAGIAPGANVLEIGPGPGALTECLLQAGASVTAVEKDSVLAGALQRLETIGPLRVIESDIMEVQLDSIIHTPTKVIANLPYHLTSPILGLIVPRSDLFSSVHVMVQDEVARRMTAEAGSKDYSSLTVFLQYYSKPVYSFFVGRKCFYPAPKVDSAVVSLYLKTPDPTIHADDFLKLVHTAFGQRRKMVRSSLKHYLGIENIEKVLEECGIAGTARPEELALPEWISLYKHF